MLIEDLRKNNLIIFECISGSRAYGLDLPTSDTDIKGVFVLPEDDFYSLDYVEQVNNESNDIVFYELRKFIDLLVKNNPNILEMLNTPDNCLIYKHELFDMIKPDVFLSKLCKNTFAGYAFSQIRKARGLNKKIVNPMGEKRKGILDFCHVLNENGSIPLLNWLEKNNFKQEFCGLVNISHMKDMYAIYYDEIGQFSGIIRKENSTDVSLSSVPKNLKPAGHMTFNKDGYTRYCKDYKEYWEWTANRNEERYQNTIEHNKNYDAKNIMHTFRLLDMAEEIAVSKKVIVRRPNRDEMLRIKRGEFEYDELLQRAEAKIKKIEDLFDKSDLPIIPDINKANELLVNLRKKLYCTC